MTFNIIFKVEISKFYKFKSWNISKMGLGIFGKVLEFFLS